MPEESEEVGTQRFLLATWKNFGWNDGDNIMDIED